MSTIITVLTLIWIVLNFFLIGLLLYIKWLGSKRRMTLYDKRVERIRRRFQKGSESHKT